MNYQLYNLIQTLCYSLPATLIAIVFHEVAHALASYICGDKMVKQEGRLSLNPFKHLDLLGTLCLLTFHMGWAKPVRVNTASYKHKRLDFCLVALAGPLMNFILAFIALIGMFLMWNSAYAYNIGRYLFMLFYYIAIINVGLGVFNLIPIPPLDGSNVLLSLLPSSVEGSVRKYSKYLPIILLIIIFSGALNGILSLINSSIINGMWSIVLKMFNYQMLTPGLQYI